MKTLFKTLLTLVIGLALLACSEPESEQQSLAPVAFHDTDECHVCGMIITDFPGPKGQAMEKASVKKFCSAAEMLGWWLQPENRIGTAKLYVHDMGRSEWAKPDDGNLIDATSAFYVVGLGDSGLKGAMGAVLASFADEQAARKLAAIHGARVLRFDEIDQDVLQQAAATQHVGMHGRATH
ncbi:nitrous oxide reductase accessory protein NosL [Pseudomonas sp.]|uniref:nitrous oxide reductase accessory protein NosL n=1 Tax=Pseudomonas sp. TaxID=306 RepID=UPI00272F3BA3|nr:nitrous oxide reductase accessory protein NosL [Pseudomonas sp.]MDP2244193.1 nitrous oxide reductase accessory protein NosL [Pseudomonas sp.]